MKKNKDVVLLLKKVRDWTVFDVLYMRNVGRVKSFIDSNGDKSY